MSLADGAESKRITAFFSPAGTDAQGPGNAERSELVTEAEERAEVTMEEKLTDAGGLSASTLDNFFGLDGVSDVKNPATGEAQARNEGLASAVPVTASKCDRADGHHMRSKLDRTISTLQSPTRAHTSQLAPSYKNKVTSVGVDEVDPSVLHELPADIRNEIMTALLLQRPRKKRKKTTIHTFFGGGK